MTYRSGEWFVSPAPSRSTEPTTEIFFTLFFLWLPAVLILVASVTNALYGTGALNILPLYVTVPACILSGSMGGMVSVATGLISGLIPLMILLMMHGVGFFRDESKMRGEIGMSCGLLGVFIVGMFSGVFSEMQGYEFILSFCLFLLIVMAVSFCISWLLSMTEKFVETIRVIRGWSTGKPVRRGGTQVPPFLLTDIIVCDIRDTRAT